jgi:protein-tyrosine kinase
MKTRQDLARGVGMAAMARVVHVAHRFPLRISPHHDPSAYLLSPATLLTRHADDFHRLRAQLTRRLGDSGMALVASARHAEGRSIAALGLSLAFAQGAARVVYVEADFRRPALHTFFDIPAGSGAADLLRGSQPMSDLSACILATDVAGLRLLPAGVRPGPPELLDSPRLPELFERLRGEGDWIIVDCPPLLSYSDALPLLSLMDGVVIVALEGRTRDEDLAELSARLALAQARVVGAISIER